MDYISRHHRRSSPHEYLENENGCWIWQRCSYPNGYGQATDKRCAHIVVWERHHGPVPPGLELDHTCRVRLCVNPAHLEPVTHAENCRRAFEHSTRPRAADGTFAAAA